MLYRWEERLEFQKKQIEKEQFLLQCIEDQRNEFIDAYQEKVDRETERMKRLFEDVKMYIRCYLARHLPGSRERVCCEKYFHDDEDETLFVESDKKDAAKVIKQDKIQNTLQKEKKRSEEKALSKDKLKQKLKQKKKISTRMEKKEARKIESVGKRRKKQKKRRKVKKKKDTQSDTKSELDPLTESIPSSKTETIEESIISEPKEKCRCQAIKDREKHII